MYVSSAKTTAELNYGKVDRESLGVFSKIKEPQMYLYRTMFMCVVDHEPGVPLYNSHSRELPVKVARHRFKLTRFNFVVVYEPGTTKPSDIQVGREIT